MTMTAYLWCLVAVVKRDAARFVHQRARLLAALVRPLLWLVVFAAGFRSILGVSIIPPYQISSLNPFTHAVEAVRFALYGSMNWAALGWTALALAVVFGLAVLGYDAKRGAMGAKS